MARQLYNRRRTLVDFHHERSCSKRPNASVCIYGVSLQRSAAIQARIYELGQTCRLGIEVRSGAVLGNSPFQSGHSRVWSDRDDDSDQISRSAGQLQLAETSGQHETAALAATIYGRVRSCGRVQQRTSFPWVRPCFHVCLTWVSERGFQRSQAYCGPSYQPSQTKSKTIASLNCLVPCCDRHSKAQTYVNTRIYIR